eukprot:Awhi_evm1s2858
MSSKEVEDCSSKSPRKLGSEESPPIEMIHRSKEVEDCSSNSRKLGSEEPFPLLETIHRLPYSV